MPVSCYSDNEEPPAKCCKFCDESTESGDAGGGPVSWRLTLDQDLIDTLKSSFPSWFPGGGVNGGGVAIATTTTTTETGAAVAEGEGNDDKVTSSEIIDSLGLLSSTSPIAERSNSSSSTRSTSSGVSSNESGASSFDSPGNNCGAPELSFRSSSISSTNSFPSSPPSLVIYATQIDPPKGQRAVYQQFLAEMAEGLDKTPSSFKQPQIGSEPPRLHIVDSFSFDGTGGGGISSSTNRQTSPPKAIVDSSPLQPAMDRNKESLKVKLLVRRPINQLVEQGIIPPLKTSPAIHEQRKQLERAKTGDLLKAKIQQRPNRQELERRHILEHEECHVDPSLAERQRMLKKARLADQLNSQISHRPGPLELIKKNILHVEEPIERIVKEGLVSFKATSEGLLNRPQQPNSYITFEDDSQNSSESGDQRISPPRLDGGGGSGGALELATTSAGVVTVALTIPTSGGAVVVTSGPIPQAPKAMPALMAVPPPPPPLPLPPMEMSMSMPIKTEIKTEPSQPLAVKSETPQRFAELCQSVVGNSASVSPSPTLVPIYPSTTGTTFSFACSPATPGTLCTLSPLSSVASPLTPQQQQQQQNQHHHTIVVPVSRSTVPSSLPKFDAPGKDKYRKKNKCKPSATKARPIKFHEYKGPPNAQKGNSAMSQAQTEETSYQLLLKQQNFLLEYLEGLHKQPANGGGVAQQQQQQQQMPKPPQILMMTETNFVQKPSFTATICNPSSLNNAINHAVLVQQQSVPSPAASIASSTTSTVNGVEVSVGAPSSSPSPGLSSSSIDLNKLEKMKVSDLKLQLKKRNLPVSGPKPQLIERLKPYLPLDSLITTTSNSVQQQQQQVKMEIVNASVPALSETAEMCDLDSLNSPHNSLSPNDPSASSDREELMEVQQVDSPTSLVAVVAPQPQALPLKEDLLREQQRKIDELQRKLRESQEELLHMKQNHTAASQINQSQSREQPINQKLIFKQQLEAKIQKEKIQQIENLQRQQKEYLANQQQVLKAALVARGNNNNNNDNSSKAQIIGTVQGQQQQQHQQQVTTTTTIKQEAPALAFNENALQQLAAANNKNVEIVWNGEQALFLVGLPQDNSNNNNRILNGHHRTTSMPSILVPISDQQLVHRPSILLQQQKMPPPYQEAKQQLLLDNSNININGQSEAKEEKDVVEVVVVASAKNDQNKAPKTKRVHRNSQMMTDVLEILIKNGDLPESAAQVPVTPTTTTVPQQQQQQEQQPQADLFNEKTRQEASIHHHPLMTLQTEPVSPPPPPAPSIMDEEEVVSIPSHEIMGDLDISSMLSNLSEAAGTVTDQHLHHCNQSLLGEGSREVEAEIENNDQVDDDDDEEDQVTKTLDMLLNGHQESVSPGIKRNVRLNGIGLGANDVVLNNSSVTEAGKMERGGGGGFSDRFMTGSGCPTEEMDHLDDFDYLALMKLDMDIGEENSSSGAAARKGSEQSSSLLQNHHQQLQSLQSQSSNYFNDFSVDDQITNSLNSNIGGSPSRMRTDNSGNSNSARTNTDNNGNPVTVDLSLLNNNNINNHHNNNNNNSSNTHNHNHLSFSDDTPMDIEDFSNSLSAFDFPFVVHGQATTTTAGEAEAAAASSSHHQMMDSSSSNRNRMAETVEQANNRTANSSSMGFDAGGLLSSSSSSGLSNNNSPGHNHSHHNSQNHNQQQNHHHLSSVFGSMNSMNDQLGMGADVPPSLLYDSHLPMGHDYSLELFDDLRIPTESMSWNEVDFPIYGK